MGFKRLIRSVKLRERRVSRFRQGFVFESRKNEAE
jgi:hypothetical protein